MHLVLYEVCQCIFNMGLCSCSLCPGPYNLRNVNVVSDWLTHVTVSFWMAFIFPNAPIGGYRYLDLFCICPTFLVLHLCKSQLFLWHFPQGVFNMLWCFSNMVTSHFSLNILCLPIASVPWLSSICMFSGRLLWSERRWYGKSVQTSHYYIYWWQWERPAAPGDHPPLGGTSL